MKKIMLILISLVAVVGCEDELDLAPISDAGSNAFYSSADDFDQAVNGIYASFGVQGGVDYPAMYVVLGESRSDNIYTPGQAGVRDWNAINNFLNTLATVGSVEYVWNVGFNAIMRANTVLDQLEKQGDVIGDSNLATRFEAEARFLRAYFYFDLVKWFGRLPLIERPVSPAEALDISRSPVEDIYNLILGDLQFAIDNLPASFSGDDEGRATSIAAQAIKARVHLTRSGPQLHPEGPCLGVDEYQQALDLLNEIIGSGRFDMLDDYASIFDYGNEGSSEIVWDFQYISGNVSAGAYYPTEYYDEAWARINLPFPGGNPGDGSKTISQDLLDSYEEGDLRIEPTFLLGYTDENGDLIDARFYDKFMNVEQAGGDRFNWSINYPTVRYTDVLMLKAEAILQGAGGTQADVDDIVNAVRERAGLDPVSDVDLDMLMEERRREFAGENLRWDDLVRTGMVVDVMNAFIESEDDSGKMQQVTNDFIIYPIPQDQMDVKQGLYEQNPGYL